MIATYICSSEGTGGGIPRQTVISLDGAGCIFVVQLIAVVPVEVKRYAEAGGHGLVPGNLFGRNSSCQEHLGSELSTRALTASGVVCWVLHALASFSESKKAYAFFPDI